MFARTEGQLRVKSKDVTGIYWCWLLILGCLVVAVAAWSTFPLSHLMSPMSFNYSEGWNAYWEKAASMGKPLYSTLPDLNITNYPPVSFHLVGLLSRLFGDVNIAGRIFGLFCLTWSALNVATISATKSRSKRAGAYAALCFLLWFASFSPSRMATNDPHFLALALSTVGVCAYLRAERGAGWVIAAAAFFVTSLFVKNSLLGFPLAAALHLLLTQRMRLLIIFTGACVSIAGLFLSLTLLVDGHLFTSHLLAQRAFSRALGLESLGAFYTAFCIPVLIGFGWMLWSRTRGTGFITLCFVCTALLAAGFSFGNGVANNIYYETIAALAIAVSLAVNAVQRSVASFSRGWVPFIIAALLPVAPTLAVTPISLYGTLGRWERLPGREANYAAALTLIKQTTGPALCESLLMCFEAGKPFIYDPYFVKDQVSIGRISEARLIADLNARNYASIQLGEDDSHFTLDQGERLRFSAATIAAVFANYRVAEQGPYYAVLLPKQ